MAALLVCALGACGKGDDTKRKRRADFTPEEFGMGRAHTRNAACNREIDALLDEIRTCYNTRTDPECATVQDEKNKEIGRIRFSPRCS